MTLRYNTLKQRADHGDILYQITRNIVALFKILGAVVGNPDFSARILPHESLKRKIDGESGRGHHQRRAAFGTSENDELSRVHFHSDFFSLAAVIDASKYGETFRLQNGVQPLSVSETE